VDETKRAWDEVGEGFVKLGRIISERYRSLGEERSAQPTGAEETGVGDSIRRATEELDRAFTSLGDTLRDDDARQHVRETGRKLSDALKVTITEVSEEVRRAVGSRRSDESSEPPSHEHPDDPGSSA
jgi:NDP-sugar pyrophosphorylase family protein